MRAPTEGVGMSFDALAAVWAKMTTDFFVELEPNERAERESRSALAMALEYRCVRVLRGQPDSSLVPLSCPRRLGGLESIDSTETRCRAPRRSLACGPVGRRRPLFFRICTDSRLNHLLQLPRAPPHAHCAALTFSPSRACCAAGGLHPIKKAGFQRRGLRPAKVCIAVCVWHMCSRPRAC